MNEAALRLVMNATLMQPSAEILGKFSAKIGGQLTTNREQVFSDAISDVYFLYGGLKIVRWDEVIALVAARPEVLDYMRDYYSADFNWKFQRDIAEATRQLIHTQRLADARETLRTSVFREETHTDFWDKHYAPIQSPADFLSLLRFESFRNYAREKAMIGQPQLEADKGRTQAKEEQSKCFIATATMGAPDAPEVIALRNYRDVVLSSNRFGRSVVMLYELMSPPIARFISEKNWLRNVVRSAFVTPLARLVRWRIDRAHHRVS